MSPGYTNVPEERIYRCRLLGTGTTPTKEVGDGLTVTRTAAGVYKITFSGFNPFALIGFYWGLGATTPGDVKGHTVTRAGAVAVSSGVVSLEVSLWSATFAADDLQATEYMDLTFVFTEF
jgi:hypothetical protein